MPTYSYKCDKCGNSFEITCSMKKLTRTKKCSCGSRAYHDFVADHASGNADSQMREYQFDSSTGTRLYPAALLTKEQVREARKQHPGFDWKKRNGCYLPVIKNRQDKKRFLKQKNWVEYD